MIMKCRNCSVEEKISIHKDGYDVVAFTCHICREQDVKRKAELADRVSNFRRVTLQNGEWYYVPKVMKKAS
jgi:hypothetical protein